MTMVFAPKLASLFDTLIRPRQRAAYGGGALMLASAALEIVVSMLIAPIMAVLQTVFLAGLPFGAKIGWPSQQRTSHSVGFGLALKRLWVPTLFGTFSLLWMFNGFTTTTLIALPVFLGPLLAIPLAMGTAWKPLGEALIRSGLVPAPEENTRPQAILALHLPAMAPSTEPRPLGDVELQPASQSLNG